MAIKTFNKVIKNSEDVEVAIEISSFPGRMGTKLGTKLAKILSSFISTISSNHSDDNTNSKLKSEGKSVLEKDVDFSRLSKVLVDNLDENKLLPLILELLTFTRVDGQDVSKPEIFDITFAAEYALLFKVLQFVLEVNFKSFFQGGTTGQIVSKFQEMLAQR
jgi:hypothetical protein